MASSPAGRGTWSVRHESDTQQFPYALKPLPDMLADNWSREPFKSYRVAFPDSANSSPEAFEAHVKDLTERDVKVAYLKNLQG